MQHSHQVGALVLAAGRGSRMQSNIPKVLHQIQNKSMLEHVLHSLKSAGIDDQTLILAKDLQPFEALLKPRPELRVCIQEDPKGTGHAVASAAVAFHNFEKTTYASSQLAQGQKSKAQAILICTGDTPALRAQTITTFLDACRDKNADFAVLGMDTPNPFGYGRLVMRDSNILRITEERDASDQEKKITFCNTGILYVKTPLLSQLLQKLSPQNAQNEYYLTDCVHHAQKQGINVYGHITPHWEDFLGVNTTDELAHMASYMEKRICVEL